VWFEVDSHFSRHSLWTRAHEPAHRQTPRNGELEPPPSRQMRQEATLLLVLLRSDRKLDDVTDEKFLLLLPDKMAEVERTGFDSRGITLVLEVSFGGEQGLDAMV